jgi:hypothetical protein
MLISPNDTLTDDEQRAERGQHETMARPRSSSFGRAIGWAI